VNRPTRVEILSRKRVFDGYFKIDEARLRYETFAGPMSPEVVRLSFERGDSVAAIVYNPDTDRLVFTHQFRFPTWGKGDGWILEAAAGVIETGGTPLDTVIREVFEETGYRIRNPVPIAQFYVSPGGSSERVFLYYAEAGNCDKAGPGSGVASEGEDIALVELTPEQVRRLLDTGEIKDAKTLVGLFWFFSHRRRV
jgi:nudix-type nucleoside diphosphatase (YffH/AdpP family)